jgi:hypothetical protein
VYVIPSSPEYIISLVQSLSDQVTRMAVYPFDEIRKFRERYRHKKCMGELGIGKTVVIHADYTVQVGRAASRIGYDKDRLLDSGFPVPRKNISIDQPE